MNNLLLGLPLPMDCVLLIASFARQDLKKLSVVYWGREIELRPRKTY